MGYGWKFLIERNGKLTSNYDGSEWTVGEWREVPEPARACAGLNCSRTIPDAHGFVAGDVLARVEYAGTRIDTGDKFTCQRMRVIKAWRVPDYEAKCAPLYADYEAKCALLYADYAKALTKALTSGRPDFAKGRE
mgnify:CR=1 FL=1